MDYRVYRAGWKEKAVILILAAAGSAGISWLFYDCLYGMIAVPLFYFLLYRMWAGEQIRKRQLQLTDEFIDALRAVSTSLMAGYSMENAWQEAQKELGMLRGRDGLMYREMAGMNRMVAMNVPLEDLLQEFALRTDSEDIREFAEVFRFAKRSGGNFTAIIASTVNRINGKFDTEKEIEVMVASKKLEQKLMDIIPLGILVYLRLSSADYLSVLYGNLVGVGFMTLCLAAYGLALYISRRVLDIRV